MGTILGLALLLLAILLQGRTAEGLAPTSLRYGMPGASCDDIEWPCKSHLNCIEGRCMHIPVNYSCTADDPFSCGDEGLVCLQTTTAGEWKCALAGLIPGEVCYALYGSQQCVPPSLCQGGRCVGATPKGGNCTLGSRGECAAGLFCSLDPDGDTLGTCRKPVPVGHNCWGVRDMAWSTPNYVCEPGASCIVENATAQTAKCRKFFEGKVHRPCHVSDRYTSCEYGLRCEPIEEFDNPNITTDGFVSGICVEYPDNNNSDDDDDNDACSDDNGCSFGFMCTAVNKKNKTAASTKCRQFINTNCEVELHVYLGCLEDQNCPFDDRSLIGNSALLGVAQPGSCSYESCSGQYNKLVCCQQKPRWETYSYTPTWSLATCDTDHDFPWYGTVSITMGVSLFTSIAIISLLSYLKYRRLKAFERTDSFSDEPLLQGDFSDEAEDYMSN